MNHARNPSTSPAHAAAFRAIALAALRADSSLSVRLARYNAAMAKARALEVQEVARLLVYRQPGGWPTNRESSFTCYRPSY